MKKKLMFIPALLSIIFFLSACSSDADVASQNLSKAADNFEINRRIIAYNGITDKYIFMVEGRCSLGNSDDRSQQLTVTCKISDTEYYKHNIGLSDNVTYLSEQIEPANVDPYHYRITFKPQAIIPDVDVRVK